MQISGLGGISPGSGLASVGSAPTNPGAETGNAFGALLESLGGVSTEAESAVADLAVGGEQDLHDVVLSVEMEAMAFDLAVQIRNRLVEAYSEVFRMQV
jgi:flagellar hook-basal body complex protein FliE